jgi:hypothetical protein
MPTAALTETMTIRLPGPMMRLLRVRARAEHVTPSELVRRLLEREVGGGQREPSALELTRRWVGSVRRRDVPAGRDARGALDDWSPDRRG